MKREPAFSGQFYPGTKESLNALLGRLLPVNNRPKQAVAVVCPHAGYTYSGEVAAAVYSSVKLPDTCVILGPNHTGRGRPFSIVKDGSWLTPLGETVVDKELASDLLKRSRLLQDDPVAHSFEHSIEVQLPFMQFLNSGFKFVPIALSHLNLAAYRELGADLADSIKASGKDILIVASSDMTHYEQQKTAAAKDKEAISAILQLDEEKLLKKIDDFDISMCGLAPVAVMLAAAKRLGAKRAELIKYQTSGDASGDYSAVVGYAGIIVL